MKDINKINKQINEVISSLEDRHLKLKNKGRLIGKLRSSRDLVKKLIIPDVSQQRELLIAMLEWGTKENMVQQDLNNEQIVDLYLSNL